MTSWLARGPSAPVHRDVAEQPVLDLVPLRRSRREVADGDLKAGPDGEGGGVVVGADVDPAGVRGDVVDAVGHCLAEAVLGEVVHQRGRWPALGPPLAAGVPELPDELLLLGVHADHRIRGALVGPGLLADVTELGVPVRVLLPLDGLGVGLQAEALGPQQAADGVGGDLVALGGQFGGQAAG